MNIFIGSMLWVMYILSLYVGVYWLMVLMDHKQDFHKKKPRKVSLNEYPFISIVIPVFNGVSTVAGTLRSATQLDYPKDRYEIIIINDGSTDGTKQAVEQEIKTHPKYNIQLINQSNQGKAEALNNALKVIKGKFFACLDADSYVDKYALRNMLKLYEQNDNKLTIVTPVMQVANPKSILQWLQKIEYVVSQFIARIMSHIDTIYVAPGPFSLYRAKVIKKLGGFDGSTGTEDQEIGYRVQKQHLRIKQCAEAIVQTVAPKTIIALYCQRRRWLRGSLLNIIKYKKLIFNRKYGDFGMFQVPINLLTYFFSVCTTIMFTYFIIWPLIKITKNLFLVRFDIIPYINNFFDGIFKTKFNIINLSMGRLFVFLLVISISILLLYFAYKHSQDTLTKTKKLYIVPYLFLYYLFISFVGFKSIFDVMLGRKLKW